jgi:serine/threonine protein kinase
MNHKYRKASYIRTYIKDNKYYLQSDFKTNKEFIINESIFNFINYFNEDTTFEDVFNEYKNNVIDDNEKIRNILQIFFRDLVNEKVLIKDNEQEPMLKAKFSKNIKEYIFDYKIVKNIASSNNLEIYKVKNNNNYFIAKGYFKDKFTFEKNYKFGLRKLKEEAKIISIFNCRSINKLHQIMESENSIFLILHYIDGVNLFSYLNNNNLSIIDRHKLVKKIIKIFTIIHKNNIIYGDIHFGNILIKKNEPLVIDFGLSNCINDLKYHNGGFPLFMPPERISGDFLNKFVKPSSFKSDIYQLGVIIYYILTNKTPFVSTNWKDLVKEKKQYKLEFLNEINDYFVIIQKCISVDETQRFNNAIELYNEIIKL